MRQHHYHDAASREGASDGYNDAASGSEADGRVMVLETIIRECKLPAEFAVVSKVGCQWLKGLTDVKHIRVY